MKDLKDEKEFLSSLMDMLEQQMGPYTEVVLHDLKKDYATTIVDIRNGHITGRQVGGTGSNLGLEVLDVYKRQGYVNRERGSEDRRVVYIFLSDKGRQAYLHHEQFHRQMIDEILKDLTQEETEALVRSLAKLNRWFRGFQEK